MRRPSVLVDGLVFERANQNGIWRVFYETLTRLARDVDVVLWLRAPAVQTLPAGVRVVRDDGRAFGSRVNLPARARNWVGRRWPAPLRCAWPRGAVFHSTYFTPCPIPGMRQVTTVYDMIAETLYPIAGDWAADNGKEKQAEIAKADRIITISAAAADDLNRFYPDVGTRVRTVALGAEHLEGPDCRSGVAPLERDYALFVGIRNGYKNFHTLLDAMSRPEWPKELRLHVVGCPLADHELRLIGALGLRDRIVQRGRLSDDELRCEYRQARCFVFPSLSEGFGLPLLEAQVNGCPVVCSDTAVFREVAGAGARYFDPRLGERLAEAVANVCEPAVACSLKATGRENVRRFSWDRTAEQTLTVYQELAECGRNGG